MSKNVKVEVTGEGQMQISYDGFVGNACFVEAEKLRLAFSSLGLDVDTKKVIENRTEVETRRLENSQSVGG